jgi:Family of unknown function (DUF6502)
MSESRADLSLAASLRLLAPLVKLLLHEGVTYPRFTNALKKAFLESGASILEANSARVNDSSLSTLTGIHRKDVREWRAVGQPLPKAKTFGAAMEVFTRWASDPDYCDAQGQPRVLDRAGGPGSFEALAASASNDVHPHTLLQELIRLGVVRLVEDETDGSSERVSLCADAFVPKQGAAEMLQLFSDNVSDHIAAAAHNLVGAGSPLLEQSVFADSLRSESAAALGVLARKVWSNAFHELVREATMLSDQDQGQAGADQRIRVGMYFYHGPDHKP